MSNDETPTHVDGDPDPYAAALLGEVTAEYRREISQDDHHLGRVVGRALSALGCGAPPAPPALTHHLQGNLTEFLAWDIAAARWLLFKRPQSVAVNALSPFKDGSDPGIDVVALSALGGAFAVIILEVKSSLGDGMDKITGADKTLQADFANLFLGTARSRIAARVGGLASKLKLDGQSELADAVRGAHGSQPAESSGCLLVPVLVCSVQNDAALERRRAARMRALCNVLVGLGWKAEQVHCCVVSADCLEVVLTTALAEACG